MIQFSLADCQTPERVELVLRQIQFALDTLNTRPAPKTVPVNTQALAKELRPQFQAGGAAPINTTGLLGGTSTLIVDTHANRLTIYPAYAQPSGAAFYETDRASIYANVQVAGVPGWYYAGGVYVALFASRPADLGTADLGFRFYATDQSTIYIWTGAAWDTITRRILIGGFYAIFTHANSADRTYTLPNETGNITYETVALTDHAIVLGNGGAKVKPGTLGTTTTVLHGNAAGDPAYSAVVLTADVSGTLPVANGGTGVTYDRIADTVDLTAQVADIGSTNFANSSAGGHFVVQYYLEVTTGDALAGVLTLTISYTDDVGATTQTTTLALTATGRISGVFSVSRASGSIAYSTTHTGIFGTSDYALRMSLVRLS